MIDTKSLKEKVLDLAIRGQLVPQDPNDEPASVLLERIREQKQQLVKEGKLKAKDIKNDTIIFKGEDNLHYEKFQDGTVKCIEDEIPHVIPESWNWVRLGFLAQYKKGPFGSSLTKAMFVADSASSIKVYEQKNAIQKNASLGDYYISEEKYESLKSFEVFPNDIIVSCAGTIGETFVLPCNMRKGIINQALMKISLFDLSILDFYLTYFDFQLKKVANEQGYGVALKNIPPFDVLKDYLVPIPPINEQRHIVTKINNIFSIVDSLNASKKELNNTIASIKSKILDLAIRGQLVPQDPNDEPASVLLERIRSEKEELIKQGKIKRDKKESIIFRGEDNSYYEKFQDGSVKCIDNEIPFELANGWNWERLGNLSSVIQYGLNSSAKTNGSHRLLRITDIQNGKVIWENVPFTTIEDEVLYLLEEGDIVFARTGATVGKSYLINSLPYPSVFASYLIRIRLLNGLSPKYLSFFFNSECYWNQIIDKSVGSGQPNCNGTSLKNLLIPIPPHQEQLRICDIINNTFQIIINIEKSLF